MRNPEGGPNPHEMAEQKIDTLLEQHFKIEDQDIPQESRQKILDFGKYIAMPAEGKERNNEKYQAIQANPENEETNNLWTIFSPSNARRMERLLNEVKDLGENPDAMDLEDAIEGMNNYLGAPLYYLMKNGYVRKAFEKLGAQKMERYLELSAERDSVRDIDFNNMEAMQKLATPENKAKQKEFDRLVSELYVALYDLGVDAARLDK